MTRQTTEPLTEHFLAASNRTAKEIATTMADSGWLILDPPYQRASVWTEDQRIALVRSWVSGIPVPAVLINDRTSMAWTKANGPVTGDASLAVVDGKQRIETAITWFAGDLAVPASWFPADHVETTVDTDDGPYVTYLGLTLPARRFMGNRAMLPLIEAKVATVEEEADLYLLINGGGTPQTESDLANAASHASEF
jgi:hypothetical protein